MKRYLAMRFYKLLEHYHSAAAMRESKKAWRAKCQKNHHESRAMIASHHARNQ